MRRPPRSTQSRSSAASDVYKRQMQADMRAFQAAMSEKIVPQPEWSVDVVNYEGQEPVSYTHLRAHETPEHLVCRLLLEKKKTRFHCVI